MREIRVAELKVDIYHDEHNPEELVARITGPDGEHADIEITLHKNKSDRYMYGRCVDVTIEED